MLSVSAAYSAAIVLDKVRMAELYDIVLANGTTHRYTNHGGNLTWNAGGDTYEAVAGLDRGPITYNTDGGFDECEVMVGMITGAIRTKIRKNILEAALVTIRLIRWDATFAVDEQITLFIGIPDVGYNASGLKLRLVSQLDSLNIVVPRHIYQPGCNHSLFDATCGLTRADYTYSGTATAGTATTLTDSSAGTVYKVDFDAGDSGNPIERGETITGGDNGYTAVVVQIIYLSSTTGTIWYVELSNANNFNDDETFTAGADTVDANGTPAEDTTFYEQGEIEMTSGNSSGERRQILSSSGAIRTVFRPFSSAIAAAETYDIYPGCDGSTAVCDFRFNNADQWRGFPWIKPVQDMIM